jgi:hypothetical protein
LIAQTQCFHIKLLNYGSINALTFALNFSLKITCHTFFDIFKFKLIIFYFVPPFIVKFFPLAIFQAFKLLKTLVSLSPNGVQPNSIFFGFAQCPPLFLEVRSHSTQVQNCSTFFWKLEKVQSSANYQTSQGHFIC